MASVTHSNVEFPLHSGDPSTLCIEPPRDWLERRLNEVWQYRELLCFFVWRDVKVRYKQTVIGVAWVVLQTLMTMGVFTLFFGRLARLPPMEGFRWALTGLGRPPDLVLLASGGMVLVMLFGGLIYFNKMESTIADVV
jgi:ABC-type polysaccharide/polyol phosphate export permease